MAWLHRVGSGLLADEMGLGKSRVLIEASKGRTLVVAPAMLMDSGHWFGEVQRWADDPSRFSFMPYSGLNTRQVVVRPPVGEERVRIGVYGRDWRTVSVLTSQLEPSLAHDWDTVIIDEAHYVKNVDAKRTAAIKQLRKHAQSWYMATGTPIPNWSYELFVLLQLIFPDEAKPKRKFGSRWRWIQQWFYVMPNPHAPKARFVGGLRTCNARCAGTSTPENPCEHVLEFARENLGDRFLQRMSEQVQTELPPLTEVTIPVRMTARQWREYKSMREEWVAELPGHEDELVAWSQGARGTIMDRMTTGLGVAKAKSSERADSGKLERLAFDLENRSRPTLVMCHYKNSAAACQKVALVLGLRAALVTGDSSPAERKRAVQGFQAGDFDVLVGTLETLAEGLTLTAADLVIFVEQSWKPSRNQQAKKRIHRMGQTRPCTVYDYVSVGPKGEHTLDVGKREVLADKTADSTRTLTAARFVSLL